MNTGDIIIDKEIEDELNRIGIPLDHDHARYFRDGAKWLFKKYNTASKKGNCNKCYHLYRADSKIDYCSLNGGKIKNIYKHSCNVFTTEDEWFKLYGDKH
jgi:hypothetical protein